MHKKILFPIIAIFTIFAMPFVATGCTADDSEVVNENLDKAAQNFEINRRVVVVNGVTDKYQLEIEGLCDMSPKDGRILVTCKTGKSEYKRHQIYTSDNVFVVVEQLESVKASAYHYRVTYKPQTIIPDVDFRGSTDGEELPQTD